MTDKSLGKCTKVLVDSGMKRSDFLCVFRETIGKRENFSVTSWHTNTWYKSGFQYEVQDLCISVQVGGRPACYLSSESCSRNQTSCKNERTTSDRDRASQLQQGQPTMFLAQPLGGWADSKPPQATMRATCASIFLSTESAGSVLSRLAWMSSSPCWFIVIFNTRSAGRIWEILSNRDCNTLGMWLSNFRKKPIWTGVSCFLIVWEPGSEVFQSLPDSQDDSWAFCKVQGPARHPKR